VAAPAWKIADSVLMHFFADQVVVFVGSSQETHLVASPASSLLRWLEGGSATEAALFALCSGLAEPNAELPTMLHMLTSAGIIEEARG
jgi:hypothetical protein